ncbi:GNAT family N-acetyltransferase [Kitasatospora sp. SUK 42]|uniref:GNAT family N-acetyltransferase n=1 Tax=Kitasatospora sp. SUK 42 TaxID=1588882 RepID=UPI0018C9BB8E|nr:GNAT family N-acetyltransferase [Kitasatospora sp. SUK 42]MBV2154041.1 GNAT family N-acetyltransferase [Kitasatospora sp. SUK 42]
MNTDSRLEQANENAAAFWLAQARAHGWRSEVRPGLTAVRCARTPDDSHRFLVTRPYAEPGLMEQELADLMDEWATVRLILEDPYGGLDLSRFGATRMPIMPVMAREPGPVEGTAAGLPAVSEAREGGVLTADEALDGDALALVERIIVEGFPLPARQPWVRNDALPERLLRDSGLRAWLGRIDGAAAGACLTYDNGRATGVYWVATMPDRRGQGVARAVLQTALAHAHPDRPATLVATSVGEPLYRQLGFTELARTCWWTRTSASG